MKHIDVSRWVKSPRQIVSIKWEIPEHNASGSTECEAWRAQYEIECLERAGYTVLDVLPA
jgi:hypothetical protein